MQGVGPVGMVVGVISFPPFDHGLAAEVILLRKLVAEDVLSSRRIAGVVRAFLRRSSTQ